jgi:DNA invertase Pin-like site-specific DNA recombinase
LAPGDVLAVTKVDRLARSLRDLLNTLQAITENGFKVLDAPALDTTTPYGKLLLNVLGALAEFERTMILSRTAEGRKAAKAAGVRFGRKPALDKFQMAEAREGRANGEACKASAELSTSATALSCDQGNRNKILATVLAGWRRVGVRV